MRPVLLTFKDPDKEELVSTEKATFFCMQKGVCYIFTQNMNFPQSLPKHLSQKIIEATISYKIRI